MISGSCSNCDSDLPIIHFATGAWAVTTGRGSYRILSLRGETPKFGIDVEGVL